MNKFNPKTVPSWVRWIAVDEDGKCWGYEVEPRLPFISINEWLLNPGKNGGRFVKLYEGKPPKNWKEELYTWG